MKITTEHLYCDCCGNEIQDPSIAGAGERYTEYLCKISFDVYYSKTQTINDICPSCNFKILSLLKSLKETK